MSCNFGQMRNEMIKDRIVIGVADTHLRRSLLQEPKLTLNGAIERGRANETIKQQLKTMTTTDEVSSIRKAKKSGSKQKHHQASNNSIKSCKYCGRSHARDKTKCAAYGKTCGFCGKQNHFEAMCMMKKQQGRGRQRKVNMCQESSSESDSSLECVETVRLEDSVNTAQTSESCHNKLFIHMQVKKKTVKFLIDTGATVNVVSRSLVPDKSRIEATTARLKMYNNTPMNTVGKTRIPMKNLKNEKKYSVACVVVDDESVQPIIGLRAARQMNLITINAENIAAISSNEQLTIAEITTRYPSLFNGELGLIKDNVRLETDPSVQPVQNPIRRIPQAMMRSLKQELDRLKRLEVIKEVSEPTEWLFSLVTVKKPNGNIRVCIDPQPLNAALKRAPVMTPILDDILPQLEGAKIFSVIDVKDGYWNLKLSEKASFLTATSTPFGNIRFLRLPFGLKVSSDQFQAALNEALHGLDGVHVIADDILIVGKGESDEAASQVHDRNLEALLKRCVEKSIKLNKDKIKLRCREVPYMGNTLTPDGLKADAAKLKAITEMPAPSDVTGVRRLMGMVNYLMRFTPNLSMMLEPIRQLTLKNHPFEWTEKQETAFRKIKQTIASDQVLKYFDPKNSNLVLQADSSRSGLGAVLLQDDRPIGFGSRSLTASEKNYAQIELELLALLYGLEHFHQIIYGRPIEVHTDHKPLENIVKKPLVKAPKRLQRMLLRLQDYDTNIVYKKGSELFVPDTLSRASLQETKGPASPRDTHVLGLEIERICLTDSQEFCDEKLLNIRKATQEDQALQKLQREIIHGWPEEKVNIPPEVKPYESVRNLLTIQNGLIFVGDRIVIPHHMRKEVIKDIHRAHLGIESCLRTAREYVFWPQMSAQIKEHCQKCETCCATDNVRQQKEELISHKIAERPWQFVSTDIFTLDGVNYLLTLDHYSNFWEVDKLLNMTAKTVIHKLKHHMARYGICESITSDNAPIFHSEDFKKFERSYSIQHRFTSPYHQSANPAERAIRTCKNIMRKAKRDHQDVYLSILLYRNTPMQGFNTSPSQKFLGRRTKTTLPTRHQLLKPEIVDPVIQKERTDVQRSKQQFYYDRNARSLPPLESGDTVRIQPLVDQKGEWEKATVVKRNGVRSYEVLTDDSRLLRRNRKHLKRTQENKCDNAPAGEFATAVPSNECSKATNPQTDRQTHTSVQKSPEKVTPRRSGRNRSKFTHYEHIP